MSDRINQDINGLNGNYRIVFFAGAETGENRFNLFTGSFIKLMKKIFEDDFELVTGINFRAPMLNVIWALNNAQKPVTNPEKQKNISEAFRQIIGTRHSADSQLIIISSSSGSVIAAQAACWLAEKNKKSFYYKKPFHLVLGASMISPASELFRKLKEYQKEGSIGTILHDEVQDEGDTSFGVGGISRKEAYQNAIGLMFPFFSGKYHWPSFLNTNAEKGHIHRRRSKTVQKAIDYIRIVLIEHRLAGDYYMSRAQEVLKREHN